MEREMSPRKLRIMLLRLSAIPIVFLVIFVRPRWEVESATAVSIELAGDGFLLAGLAIRIWSILYVGGRKSHELVTTGPYSICRNPLYVGTFLLVIGVGLCFENLPVLLLTAVIILPVHVVVVRLEERHLASIFPEAYPAYMKRVPRFRPRLSTYESPEMVSVSVRAIRRVMVDTLAVLLIPEIEDLLEMLHHYHLVPVLWYFP